MVLRGSVWSFAVLALLALPDRALAAFHFMEIEQVIAGVDGDTAPQAIQLRMRFAGQNLLGGMGRIRAWDAAGANPQVLIAFGANVPNGAPCARVLIATPEFENVTSPPVDASERNFTMAAIPPSYLAAGTLTFENSTGTLVYWRLSWGGASYTGPGTVVTILGGGNDADGEMNPPFANALPTETHQALRFTPACAAAPTNNAAQYALTAGDAVFGNNTNPTEFFTVVGGPDPVPVFPGSAGLVLVGALGALAVGSGILRRRLG